MAILRCGFMGVSVYYMTMWCGATCCPGFKLIALILQPEEEESDSEKRKSMKIETTKVVSGLVAVGSLHACGSRNASHWRVS